MRGCGHRIIRRQKHRLFCVCFSFAFRPKSLTPENSVFSSFVFIIASNLKCTYTLHSVCAATEWAFQIRTNRELNVFDWLLNIGHMIDGWIEMVDTNEEVSFFNNSVFCWRTEANTGAQLMIIIEKKIFIDLDDALESNRWKPWSGFRWVLASYFSVWSSLYALRSSDLSEYSAHSAKQNVKEKRIKGGERRASFVCCKYRYLHQEWFHYFSSRCASQALRNTHTYTRRRSNENNMSETTHARSCLLFWFCALTFAILATNSSREKVHENR